MYSSLEYSVAKSGIISMTSWLAKYYKNKKTSPENIRTNVPIFMIPQFHNTVLYKFFIIKDIEEVKRLYYTFTMSSWSASQWARLINGK